MVETTNGTNRSAGVTYQQLLDEDSHPVPEIMRVETPLPPGPTVVSAERYYSKAFHDLEVEKLWRRVWQMACHEDDIPDVGDYHVYEVATLSFLVVRTGPDEFRAFHNACLHRGRMLKIKDGKHAREFRCAFHGWAWNTDGSLKEVPCHWDFPRSPLQPTACRKCRWAAGAASSSSIRIPDAEPLEEFLGNLSDQFPNLPYEKRYKVAHVAKILRCNWKVAQEAFSEAYHVIATHPTILESIGDANTQYDVFGNYSRAMSANFTPSPHLDGQVAEPLEDGRTFTRLRHALTGHIYERGGDGLVHVTNRAGEVSRFKPDGSWVEGPLTQPDPNMCDWIGGEQLPGPRARRWHRHPRCRKAATCGQVMAAPLRESHRKTLGDVMDSVPDAELLDSIYLTVFPELPSLGFVQPDRLPVPAQR